MYMPRKTWKPNVNEPYLLVYTDNGNFRYGKRIWHGDPQEERYYRIGFVCETEDEALKLVSELSDCVSFFLKIGALKEL